MICKTLLHCTLYLPHGEVGTADGDKIVLFPIFRSEGRKCFEQMRVEEVTFSFPSERLEHQESNL
jgi:hypothetical protein